MAAKSKTNSSRAAKKIPKRRPLKGLYVEGIPTEDRAVWKGELQRHCQEASDDNEKTTEKQMERIK